MGVPLQLSPPSKLPRDFDIQMKRISENHNNDNDPNTNNNNNNNNNNNKTSLTAYLAKLSWVLFNVDKLEIAKQLTLIEYKLVKQIKVIITYPDGY